MVVAIIVIVVVVLAVVAAVAYMQQRRRSQERTANLRDKFGPEYDRTVERSDKQGEAEADLERRAERRDELDIRPLAPESRDRFAASWEEAQGRFVDDPRAAIADADTLVRAVMSERGYPVHDFDRRADDLSVDHPHLVDHFRGAATIAERSRHEDVSTEDQRQAMVHYRELFDELLGGGGTRAAAPEATREGSTAVHERGPVEQEQPRASTPRTTEGGPGERTVGERPA